MRVALDATPLIVPTGGIRRYVEELVKALTEGFPEDRFDLISDQPNPPAGLARHWWLWGVHREMRRLRTDVFHGVDFSVPYLPLRPSVMTLHDLSPWRFGAEGRVTQRTPYLLGFKAATFVITPSEAIRREAIREFRLPSRRVVAVPLAAPAWMRPVMPEGDVRPYFLCVGTLSQRKNVDVVLEAWRTIRRSRAVDLILVGRLAPGYPPPAVEQGLRLLGAVADRELPRLYTAAQAVLYPSLYEGFGLPVLEAMQCGALAITSRDPALLETGGSAALAVDAQDVRGWAAAMAFSMDSPDAGQMRMHAVRHAARFSWTQTAERTHEVYLEARRAHRTD